MAAPRSVKEAIDFAWVEMKTELGAADPSPLVKLLIQQVVLAWMRLGYVEYAYTNITGNSIRIARADYWERRLNTAQRRFVRASETLARVRKMGPVIQVNIAGQQVNGRLQGNIVGGPVLTRRIHVSASFEEQLRDLPMDS
jgi:hypothetical protein